MHSKKKVCGSSEKLDMYVLCLDKKYTETPFTKVITHKMPLAITGGAEKLHRHRLYKWESVFSLNETLPLKATICNMNGADSKACQWYSYFHIFIVFARAAYLELYEYNAYNLWCFLTLLCTYLFHSIIKWIWHHAAIMKVITFSRF